jgi:hypothetical protein
MQKETGMTMHDEPIRGGVFAAQDTRDDDVGDDLLRVLLEAYAPAAGGGDADDQGTVSAAGPQDEVATAQAVAERLFADDVALRFLPASAREVLGPVQEWRWCLAYVRCCWMFGWLICRGCRDYRALNYYLYRYWLCVRQALSPRGRELTRQDREDFEALSAAMGERYRDWLKDELARAELGHGGIVDDVLDGQPDCCRDNAFTSALFERLASPQAAAALLGREAFAAHSKHPYFWLCRCWCQAAIRLGCCMACARTRRDYERCIREYQAALDECLKPLHCELTGPTGCWEEEPLPVIHSMGVTVTGTVAGAFFGGYTIEWRLAENRDCDDPTDWRSVDVFYPGGGSSGGVPVVNGTLGWLKTRFLPARTYEVRVCPRSTRPAERVACCCTEYNLFKKFVMIEAVGAAQVGPGGIYDANAPLVYPVAPSPTPHLVPIGCCVHIRGAAWVGECEGRRIKCVTLRYAPGFLPGPFDTSSFDPGVYTSLVKPPLCYEPPDETEKRDQPNQLTAHHSVLTTSLVQKTHDISALLGEPPGTTLEQYWTLQPQCWNTATLPACLDATHRCASGQYTLLLDVEDQMGNHYYDTQQVWFDNKPLHLALAGLQGAQGCDEISLRRLTDGRGCGTPWPRAVMGISFDEWIVESDSTYPSNNFDYYRLTIHKNCGGPAYPVPITPDLVRWHKDIVTGTEDPLKGTERVGEPGTRCPCEPQPMQVRTNGVLTMLDLRAFDAQCAGQLQGPFRPPPGFALGRGECCAYTFVLESRDKTVDEVGPGNCHRRQVVCAFCVCNDLPSDGVTDTGGGILAAVDRVGRAELLSAGAPRPGETDG